MKKAVLFLLAFLPYFLHAQNKDGKALIDSLQAELPNAKADTNKVLLLVALSRRFYEFDIEQGSKYGKEALLLAQNLKYTFGIAKAYNVLGGIHYLKGENEEALKCNNTALKLYQDIGNKVGMANCYLTIGNSYGNQDNFPESFKNYFAALKMYEEAGEKKQMIGVYNNIGAMYHSQKNDSEAMKNYSAGLRLIEETEEKKMLPTFKNNIGNIYCEAEKFPEALKNYSVALAIYKEIGQKNGLGNTYANIGAVYKGLGNYQDALKNYLTALPLLEEVGNKYNLGTLYHNIGFILEQQKKYKDAEQYYHKQLALGRETGSLLLVKDAYHGLSRLYETTGDLKKSLESYRSFVLAKDSVFNRENEKKTVQAQMQYDFDKKESLAKAEQAKKDAILKVQLQHKNVVIYGTLSLLVLLIVIGILLMRQSRLRINQQKVELEQKQLRAQMNPHFIFNCLNSIQHFVVANDVKNANKYLTGFAALMRQTLENSKEATITLRNEIAYLENYLVLECMRFENTFTVAIVCADNVDKDNIEIPPMIIQPFIENAIRHGLCFLGDKKGALKINFYTRDNSLFCEVDDNGIGRERSQQLKATSTLAYESQGMELTRQRLALVSKSSGSDYTITVIDKKNGQNEPEGTTVVIKFPMNVG